MKTSELAGPTPLIAALLPDDFSESKDWQQSDFIERIEWLKSKVISLREELKEQVYLQDRIAFLEAENAMLRAQNEKRKDDWK